MRKLLYIAVLLYAGILSAALPKPDTELDFSKKTNVKLTGSAQIENGLLKVDGGGHAVVPGGEQYSITRSGLTISGVIRFRKNAPTKGFGQDIFSKGKEWLISRNSRGGLYVHYNDGKAWAKKALRCVKMLQPEEWGHYAVVFKRIDRSGQGETGYLIRAFINGEKCGDIEVLHQDPSTGSAPFQLGEGLAKSWEMRGDFASVKIWKKALTDDEVEQDAASSRFVKLPQTRRAVEPSLAEKLNLLKEPFLKAALVRAAENGADQKFLTESVKQYLAGKKQNSFTVHGSGRTRTVLLHQGIGTAFPVAGWYDLRDKRELFGRRTMAFELQVMNRGKAETWRDTDSEWNRKVELLDNTHAKLAWTRGRITVEGVLSILDNRLELPLNVYNQEPEILLKKFSFPVLSLAKLPGKDKLLLPFMSGVEHSNPVEKQSAVADQEYIYPTSNMNMQFFAYYNEKGGIYFAHEDPKGYIKHIAVLGRRGNLDGAFTTNAEYPYGAKGGNSLEMSGKAVLEVYDGNWYEASQIYRKFVSKEAVWWCRESPRANTPEWFRNNAVWFSASIRHSYTHEKLKKDAFFLRDYFEIPIGLKWGEWYDREKGGWPHFIVSDKSLPLFQEFRKKGIRTEVYVDARLWAEKDGPGNRSVWMYEPFGKKYATRSETGAVTTENYTYWYSKLVNGKRQWLSERQAYDIMCPGARGWQEWMGWMTQRVAGYGTDGVYHDQIMAALPVVCYNPEHKHLMNSSRVWVDGYRKMYAEEVRPLLKEKYSHVFHASEDAAESYLGILDACLAWRWTHQQIPLFMAVYGGRTQVYGWTFGDCADSLKKSDVRGFFAKCAEQLVTGCQLGSFQIYNNGRFNGEHLNGEAMLYAKRLSHLRLALLPYFNAGKMLAPLKFTKELPTESIVWNAYLGGSGGGNVPITHPVVRSGFYRGDNGVDMAVFVNSSKIAADASPVLPAEYESMTLLSGGKATAFKPGNSFRVEPYGIAVILAGNKAVVSAEASRLEKVLKKIAAFVPPDYQELSGSSIRPGVLIRPGKFKRIVNGALAEDGSFAGWLTPGALLEIGEFQLQKPLSAVEIDLEAVPGTLVRVVNGNKQIGSVTVKSSGRKKYTIPCTPLQGKKLIGLHFPKGAVEFYGVTVKEKAK